MYAAARPSPAEQMLVIHTAGRMSKGRAEPRFPRTAATVAGISWMEAVFSTTRRHIWSVASPGLRTIRPISGSAALAVGADLMAQYGPDSAIGRTAAVMLGSTETTFYTISVYFGAAGVKKTRYAIPAALIADLTGFCVASWMVRWMF